MSDHPEVDDPQEMNPMNEAKRRFFSGDSLQQAIIQAANYFNLDPDWVAYRSLEKRHGFLKTRRKVVIEVDPDNPRRESPLATPKTERAVPPAPPSGYLKREPAAAAPRPAGPSGVGAERPPREARGDRGGPRPERGGERRGPRGDRGDRGPRGPRGDRGGDRSGDRGNRAAGGDRPRYRDGRSRANSDVEVFRLEPPAPGEELVTLPERPRGAADRYPAATGPVAEAAVKAADLLLRIAGLDLKAQAFQGEERLEIDLSGTDTDWCFENQGELLQAVEHLLPRMIRSLSGEAFPVRVDCDNFHEIREEQLRSLAQKVAEDVRRQSRPRMLEPMNPSDRRIIHTTLADDPNVVTESEGDGYFKRIMVRPA